jgi:hypothetical protein
MGNGREERKALRQESSRILYDDLRYFIGVSNKGVDEHHLLVNSAYAFLGRGIFNELARSDKQRLEATLRMIGGDVLYEMFSRKIPLDELGWVLAKAAIKDQEDYAHTLFRQDSRG